MVIPSESSPQRATVQDVEAHAQKPMWRLSRRVPPTFACSRLKKGQCPLEKIHCLTQLRADQCSFGRAGGQLRLKKSAAGCNLQVYASSLRRLAQGPDRVYTVSWGDEGEDEGEGRLRRVWRVRGCVSRPWGAARQYPILLAPTRAKRTTFQREEE